MDKYGQTGITALDTLIYNYILLIKLTVVRLCTALSIIKIHNLKKAIKAIEKNPEFQTTFEQCVQ